jgi:hypothetical protein
MQLLESIQNVQIAKCALYTNIEKFSTFAKINRKCFVDCIKIPN